MWAKEAGGQHHSSPFITAWVSRTTPHSAQGNGKHGILSFHHSLFLFILPLWAYVRVCWRVLAYTWRDCSISSGFSPYYPLKWAQNRILSCHYARDWLCWQQTFFMQNTQKQFPLQQERSQQISLTMKTARVWTVFPSFSNEISKSKFRMCCSTNVRSILCHLHFNK